MREARARRGWRLALWGLATTPLALIAPIALKRRLARGKEDAARWREKLGEPSAARPEGRLIWLHAVGLGEVLALRGLIAELSAQDPELNFLITSSARSSAEALAGQMPARARHQFLPLDVPQYLRKFLAHWRPDLSIWAEQDLWPGAVAEAARAGVPLAMVNARMSAASFAKRSKARGLYGEALAKFALIAAQDPATAAHLTALGAKDVRVTGALKAAAPPLRADEARLAEARAALQGRETWLLASSHPEDEAVALKAQSKLQGEKLLLLAPRDPHRGPEIAATALALGLKPALRSRGEGPSGADLWILDSFGEMGLWYRIAPIALVGGTFGPTEGHNPWEPAALSAAVLHGPRVANFMADYAQLAAAKAAYALDEAGDNLVDALRQDHAEMVQRAYALHLAAQGSLAPLARDLLKVME